MENNMHVVLLTGITIMSCSLSNFNKNTENKAPKILADFLRCLPKEIKYTQLSGGLAEGAVNKCRFQDKEYLVKLFDSYEELGKHESAWTRHASDLGIGPHMYYADPSGKFLITEYMQGHSLTLHEAHNPAILKILAHKLLLLHTSSASWAQAEEIMPSIERKYKNLTTNGPLKELLEKNWHRIQALQDSLKSVSVPPVPCHNDLNPRNIFVGENNTITIIDWGDASLSNPYYDIAIFSVLHQLPEDSETFLLQEYNPHLLEPVWHDYFKCLKQLVRFEFALNLLSGVHAEDTQLLYKNTLPIVEDLKVYIKSFESYAPLKAEFLYTMALASLNQLLEKS